MPAQPDKHEGSQSIERQPSESTADFVGRLREGFTMKYNSITEAMSAEPEAFEKMYNAIPDLIKEAKRSSE